MNNNIQTESIDALMDLYHRRLSVAGNGSNTLIRDMLNAAYNTGRDRGTLAHPRYTRIDIEGRPDHLAIFSRKDNNGFIEVEIFTPEIELASAVPVNDREQQLIGAWHIHHELLGYDPNTAELDLYMRPIEHIAGSYQRGIPHGQ